MGILEVLTVIFVVMKCLGHFDHSWWVVFSPLLVAAGIYVLWFAIVILGAAVGGRKAVRHQRSMNEFRGVNRGRR